MLLGPGYFCMLCHVLQNHPRIVYVEYLRDFLLIRVVNHNIKCLLSFWRKESKFVVQIHPMDASKLLYF